ncbi:MAG TPA: thiamine pyrophosphate-dependent enzyme [Burkholderiales bacterium]|nr:thiamine pyrophosphate-dependent enzyme [Burkholderiales bacterium]
MPQQKKPVLERRDVMAAILKNRGDALLVTGLGSPTYDAFAAGDHPLNFYLWGAMGGAAMIGLGLALAQPKRRVLVVTGDGEMLMGLGSVATIAAERPKNLSIVVLDNQHYGETGMQPTHTGRGVDLPGMAKAAGFAATATIYSAQQLKTWIPRLYRSQGPVFATVKVTTNPVPMALPLRDGTAIKHRFREALLGAKAFE